MMFEVIAMCVLSAGAGDGPQSRGPNSDGHAVETLYKFAQ